MSRIAKSPVLIPAGVAVSLQDKLVTAKGPKGDLSFLVSKGIQIVKEDNYLKIEVDRVSESEDKHIWSMAGTTRAMINNIVTGVATGFEKKLVIVGVGYRAQVQGKKLILSLGFSHPIEYQLSESVTAEAPSQTEIILRSADKQVLGQTAAEVRAFRPPEPYKGKGVRYVDEYIVRKQAKKK